MAKVTKSTPKRKGFYARAEDDIDNPCCGKSKNDWKNPAGQPASKEAPAPKPRNSSKPPK